VHISEQHFFQEECTRLQKELDKIQNRLSKMYDDRLDGMIDDELYQKKFQEGKTRQQEIVSQMERHIRADEQFYITANTVMRLASRAREIFESSEVGEKRQLLNFVFQNLQLDGEKLTHTFREPFSMIMKAKECPSGWWQLDKEPTES
jgi:DNA gyrase/topoisomerase IV subunit A